MVQECSGSKEKSGEKSAPSCSAKIIGRSSLFDLIQYNDRIKTFFDIIDTKIKNGPVFAAIAGIHCGGRGAAFRPRCKAASCQPAAVKPTGAPVRGMGRGAAYRSH